MTAREDGSDRKSLRRYASILTIGLLGCAGVVVSATPSHAATVNIPVPSVEVEHISAAYGDLTVGSETEKIGVTLPPEIAEMPGSVTWSLYDGVTFTSGSVPDASDPFEIPLSVDIEEGTLVDLSVTNATIDFAPPTFGISARFAVVAGGAATVTPDLALSNAVPINPFDPNDTGVGIRSTFTTEDDTRVNWGDTIVLDAPAGTWLGAPEPWVDKDTRILFYPADFTPIGGIEIWLNSTLVIGESGATLTVTLPSEAPAGYNWSSGTYMAVSIVEQLQTSFGTTTGGSLSATIGLNFFPTSRIAGYDRYDTAARVAQEFDSADYVYIANGLNFPDALGAAPAAAFRDAPLLTTAPTSLHWGPREQLLRLQPDHIIIVGGPGSLSEEVETSIEALYPGTQVQRIAGVDRYDTSRKIVEDIYGDGVVAPDAFFATGVNFPDALASSAAAAHLGAPVILVPGAASTVDAATLDLATDVVDATQAYIAGGEGTVSAGIEETLLDRFGTDNVDRLAGSDRYSTSVKINELFQTSETVYLAAGTGYADALAGAALAGVNDAPLFTVPNNCVPQAVLDAIDDLGATKIVLLGGIGTLSPAVGELTPC